MRAMTFELSREHEEFRRSVREFAEAEIAPHAAQWDRDHHFPVDVVQKMGKLGLFGPHRARGVRRRRRGRRLHQPVRGDRGDRPRRPVDGHHPRGGGRPRHQPDPDLRHRRAEGSTWLPDLVAGPDARRLRPDRARRRLRRRGDPHQGRARRRRVGRQRRQAVHHQLRLRDHLAGHGHRPHRRRARTARPRSRRSSCPRGTPGFTAEKAYDKLGWHASDTHPLTFERRAACPRPTCSASGAAATRSSSPPSTTAGSPSPRWRSAASRPAST